MSEPQGGLLKKILDSLGTSAKGLTGFILSLFFDKVIQAVTSFITKYLKQKKEDKKNDEALKVDQKNAKAYKEVLQKESTTREEVKNATSDLLNKL